MECESGVDANPRGKCYDAIFLKANDFFLLKILTREEKAWVVMSRVWVMSEST